MEKLSFNLDGGSSTAGAQGFRQLSLERCFQSLVHACHCRVADCNFSGCRKMKHVLQHAESCKRKMNIGCPVCKQLVVLCHYHANLCQEAICPVPFCMKIKPKLRQKQQLQQRVQLAQILKTRTVTKQNGGLPSCVSQPSSDGSNCAVPFPSPDPSQPDTLTKLSINLPFVSFQTMQQVPAVTCRKPDFLQSIGGMSSWEGIQAQSQQSEQTCLHQPYQLVGLEGPSKAWEGVRVQSQQQPEQTSLRQPDQLLGLGSVPKAMGGTGALMGPPWNISSSQPVPRIQSPTQALHKLFQMQNSPPITSVKAADASHTKI